ncbi:hypothetical protein [Streptomyces sp. NPDC056549]|uniref:hypothetical protein n=1 Tax=Streptomyces sp. NPDC056549 TaxID=3345864 RepID=UPI0036BBE4FD
MGTTILFDTQGVAQGEQECWFDLVAQAETLEGAERLSSHFVSQITSEQADPFWSQAAANPFSGLFRAAWWGGGTVRKVMR